MTTYTINCTDTDRPMRWMDLAAEVRQGAQDSGRCRFTARVEDAMVARFERRLEASSLVLAYEVIGSAPTLPEAE